MNDYVLPDTMTAVVLTGTNNQYEIRSDVPVPQDPGYQEVICKVMAIAICGTDPKLLKGKPYHYCPEEYPFIIGHEWSGIVMKVGPGVFNLKPGDRVAGEAHRGCGVCKNCKEGRYSLCLNYGNDSTGHRHYGFTTQGAYAQYVRYSCGSLTLLPDNVSFEEAAMCDTAGVAFHGLSRAGVTPGGTVCVIGPGPIGLMSMKIARCLGAAHVIAIGRGARLKAAVATGACDPDMAIDFESCEDIIGTVMNMTNGIGPDGVYEASGSVGAMAQAIEMCKKGGNIVLLGTPPEGTMVEIPMKKITFKELTIFGSRGNPNVTPAVVSLMSTGQLNVKDLVTHTFPLTEFSEGIDTFVHRKGGAVKVIFYPNEQPEVPFVQKKE
ncbi:MAG: alcohol dehydrogenase catalytic domain-containing protein [Clostridiales bacterium]|nr:alcohol dehydrogenase catalytic domain-containing protein [Clostridiales bacterium]